jgi:hypothetical protein
VALRIVVIVVFIRNSDIKCQCDVGVPKDATAAWAVVFDSYALEVERIAST